MRPNIHPFPLNKANELINGFAQRPSVTILPLLTQQDLDKHFEFKNCIIQEAIHELQMGLVISISKYHFINCLNFYIFLITIGGHGRPPNKSISEN